MRCTRLCRKKVSIEHTRLEHALTTECRKSWLYEVPLGELHALRNSINASRASLEEVTSTMRHFNAPVLAGNVKLYLLELNPPVLGWEGWEDAKAVYPTGGFCCITQHDHTNVQSERTWSATSPTR